MKRNEKGIAVPGEYVNLPLRHLGAKGVPAEVVDAMGVTVTPVIYGIDTAEFIIYAANFHERLADIVRRLLEHSNKIAANAEPISDILDDAAALWTEYQENAE